MPSPRRALRAGREQWGLRHFAHLLSSHDWKFIGREGWGDLSQLDDAALAETVADMSECFAAHGHQLAELTEGIHHDGDPWFSDYAYEPERLIAEVIAEREYLARYPHGDRCRCPSCESQSSAVAPAAGATN